MIENKLCNNVHESVESSNNSMNISSFNKDENDTPSKEVLCKEKVICCSNDYDFSYFHTNFTVAISFSDKSDYDQSHEDLNCDEVLLSVDEILELLAHDLKRYANVSLDAHAFPYGISSQGEVISPRFDVEFDIKL